MNIEDLIRQANPVKTGDAAAGDSPHAQRTLARVLAQHADPRARGRSPRAWLHWNGKLVTASAAFLTAGATAAVLLSAAPHQAPRKSPGAAPHASATTRQPTTGEPATARQVLLTAAAHVLSGPATGAYWRVQMISGLIWPGGTKAHPYDISVATGYDQWNPRSAGQKEFEITQQLGTRPATAADAAQWRAAGSPTTWHSGQYSNDDRSDYWLADQPWTGNLAATTVASPRSATWTVSDGTVGYIEGDETGLNAAQFGQLPADPAAVAAVLRQYADRTGCVQSPNPDCSSENQIVWEEALLLLEDPVSAQVRAATFTVMASLPGVRLLGPMSDPLGRSGYGIAAGTENPGRQNQAVLIDPASGSLLATEYIGPIPSSVQCITRQTSSSGDRCIGSSFIGRSYNGQVDEFVALVSAQWTDASPSLPRNSREDPNGFSGLPPAAP